MSLSLMTSPVCLFDASNARGDKMSLKIDPAEDSFGIFSRTYSTIALIDGCS
jgi:hypothetical protein